MARGSADYGYFNNQVATTQYDMSALIPYLRGVVSIDGRGRIIYLDTFTHGLAAWAEEDPDEESIYIDDHFGKVLIPPVSCHFHTTLGGDPLSISKSVGVYADGRVGFEIWGLGWMRDGETNIQIYKTVASGLSMSAWLKYTRPERKFYIQNSAGTFVEVLDMSDTTLEDWGWFPIKLVADFATRQYVRLIIASQEIDISAYDLCEGAVTGSDCASFFYEVIPSVNGAGDSYLGGIILTMDEP